MSAMWCDGFDCDLPTVVPGSREALGDTAEQKLFTYSMPTDGKINCPSAWNEVEGLVSYFGFKDPSTPRGRTPTASVMECTFLEAVRDLWIHQHLLYVEGVQVWNPSMESTIGQAFEVLMYHTRRWVPVPQVDVERYQKIVLFSLTEAADRLRCLVRDQGRKKRVTP